MCRDEFEVRFCVQMKNSRDREKASKTPCAGRSRIAIRYRGRDMSGGAGSMPNGPPARFGEVASTGRGAEVTAVRRGRIRIMASSPARASRYRERLGGWRLHEYA